MCRGVFLTYCVEGVGGRGAASVFNALTFCIRGFVGDRCRLSSVQKVVVTGVGKDSSKSFDLNRDLKSLDGADLLILI